MPAIWCAISGHGYGHAAQVVPVLNRLARLVPDLTAILRTTVPASFFHDRLNVPWDLQSVQQDVGCIQKGPLDIDVPATWEAYLEFHSTWHSRIAVEVRAMQTAAPTVILADTPYLAILAGKQAGIPGVVLANFTWPEVLSCFDGDSMRYQSLLPSMQDSYGEADMALRIAPGLPLAGCKTVLDIGPIAEPAGSKRTELRSLLKVTESERLVLVGFGGIPLESLPWDHMTTMKGYRFIVDGVPPQWSSRTHALSTLPFFFKAVLASVDIVMTKPGYGTIVEAVSLAVPVIYVRRYNFADEAPLVEFLHRYGQGHELTREEFHCGRWEPAFEAMLRTHKAIIPPALAGADEAARWLIRYFQ
jgi:hypothetical protein